LPAATVAHLVRTREISAREAAEITLRRLDAVNPKVNAIVEHRPDLVLQQADRIDSMIARGEDPGPLAGVPGGWHVSARILPDAKRRALRQSSKVMHLGENECSQ
jgi:Asp-tRNA(Asn)/Glu-tRNA(Gln) amidotransferase A subunit family amidase